MRGAAARVVAARLSPLACAEVRGVVSLSCAAAEVSDGVFIVRAQMLLSAGAQVPSVSPQVPSVSPRALQTANLCSYLAWGWGRGAAEPEQSVSPPDVSPPKGGEPDRTGPLRSPPQLLAIDANVLPDVPE